MAGASADRRRWDCPNNVPKCGLLDDYEAPNPSHMCGDCGYLYCGICAGDAGGFTCGVCARGSDGRAAWGSDDDTGAGDGGAGAGVTTKAKAMQLLAAAEPGADKEGLLPAYCAFARAVRDGEVTAADMQAAGWADALGIQILQYNMLCH